MDKKKLIIIVILIAAVVGFFIWKNNQVVGGQTIPISPSSTPPGTSNDPGSSLPSPVSQQGAPAVTPVAIPSVAATFAPGTTDAQVQGSGTTSDPLGGMPSGFQTWVNSLGPVNKNRVLTLIPSFTSDEINMINTLVTQNKWGDPILTPLWNNFNKKYALPIGKNFSNFQTR